MEFHRILTNLSHSSWQGPRPGSWRSFSTAYLSLVNGTTVEDIGSGNPLFSDSDRDECQMAGNTIIQDIV